LASADWKDESAFLLAPRTDQQNATTAISRGMQQDQSA